MKQLQTRHGVLLPKVVKMSRYMSSLQGRKRACARGTRNIKQRPGHLAKERNPLYQGFPVAKVRGMRLAPWLREQHSLRSRPTPGGTTESWEPRVFLARCRHPEKGESLPPTGPTALKITPRTEDRRQSANERPLATVRDPVVECVKNKIF